jgi:hypothetical protein
VVGTRPSLGIAGREAAGGCHLFQEMRSCGSDKIPTAGGWGQLGPPVVSCMAQNPKLRRMRVPRQGQRPQNRPGCRRVLPEASRILRRDLRWTAALVQTPRNTETSRQPVAVTESVHDTAWRALPFAARFQCLPRCRGMNEPHGPAALAGAARRGATTRSQGLTCFPDPTAAQPAAALLALTLLGGARWESTLIPR